MPDQNDGQPGRGVVGADFAEAFAARRAILHLLQVATHQSALAAAGAAPQQGPGHGGFQGDSAFGGHGSNIVRRTQFRRCAPCRCDNLHDPQKLVTLCHKA